MLPTEDEGGGAVRSKSDIYSLVQCVVHIEPRSKEVSFNTQGISSFVKGKEIFVKGRGPVGLRISKEKY